MKGSKLNSAFVRRREAEQMKIEKSAAVDKYFDKWGRITSRYEQWTTPEYYKQADENFKRDQEIKLKSESLEKRREKLRKMLDTEREQLELESNELRRPKPRKLSTDMLHGIHETIKRTEEEKRRLDLESRLYKRWRNGFCEESILLDSKSDHEALAKMNWLDKQVALHLERDKEKRENEQRHLRLQEEARKQEEYLNQRRIQRDEEMKELTSFQENHVTELKEREKDNNNLREEETRLKQRKHEIAAELALIESNSKNRKQRMTCPLNMRRIKMLLRQRSDAVRKDLRDDIDMLCRIDIGCTNEQINIIKEKFEMQYDMEIQKQTQIVAMYESEAKHLLLKEEQVWLEQAASREKLLKQLVVEQLNSIDDQFMYNEQRQRDINEIKETHLKAVEHSNQRLKDLMDHQRKDENKLQIKSTVVDDICNSLKENVIINEEKNKNDNIIRKSDLFAPRFGKKKVAWT